MKTSLTYFHVFFFLFSFLFLQLQPDAVLILYNFSGQCSGEALVTFPSEEIARRAVAERSNHPFYGQQVHLVFCNWPLAQLNLPLKSTHLPAYPGKLNKLQLIPVPHKTASEPFTFSIIGPFFDTHLTLLGPTLPESEHPQVKQLESSKLCVVLMTLWMLSIALLCICTYCNSWLWRREGVEPGHNSGSVYLNALHTVFVPSKTVQIFILKCLRFYKPLQLLIFSVYFRIFHSWLLDFGLSLFMILCVSSMQTQMCLRACIMFIHLMVSSGAIEKPKKKKKAIKTDWDYRNKEWISDCQLQGLLVKTTASSQTCQCTI